MFQEIPLRYSTQIKPISYRWMFNCEKARKKLAHAYVQLIPEPNGLPLAA